MTTFLDVCYDNKAIRRKSWPPGQYLLWMPDWFLVTDKGINEEAWRDSRSGLNERDENDWEPYAAP